MKVYTLQKDGINTGIYSTLQGAINAMLEQVINVHENESYSTISRNMATWGFYEFLDYTPIKKGKSAVIIAYTINRYHLHQVKRKKVKPKKSK